MVSKFNEYEIQVINDQAEVLNTKYNIPFLESKKIIDGIFEQNRGVWYSVDELRDILEEKISEYMNVIKFDNDINYDIAYKIYRYFS